MPRWLWAEWALIVQAADANVHSWMLWKVKRDTEFHRMVGMP